MTKLSFIPPTFDEIGLRALLFTFRLLINNAYLSLVVSSSSLLLAVHLDFGDLALDFPEVEIWRLVEFCLTPFVQKVLC